MNKHEKQLRNAIKRQNKLYKKCAKKNFKKVYNAPSPNADNRAVCPKTGRMKYQYATLEKAKKACQFSPDRQRAYYCRACCCYHTTSKTKREYYAKLSQYTRRRYGYEPIEARRDPLDKNYHGENYE